MKKNVMSKIWAMAVAGSVFFMSACNNSDYTKSPATEGGNAPANTDTVNNVPMKDTTSAAVPGSASGKTANKKGKVTIGNLSEKRTTGIKADKDGVYETTETRPMYPGGQAALENYINNNIEYQQPAIDESTQGTVNVQFVVDENGNVTNAKEIGKDLGNGLDQEAVRVISSMPKWTPGKVKGKNVKTRVVLPVTYKIEQ